MCARLLLRSDEEEVCQAFEDQCGKNPIRPKKREEAPAFNFHLCRHTQHTSAGARSPIHKQTRRITTRAGLHKPITTVVRRHPSDADASTRRQEKLISWAAAAVIEGAEKTVEGKKKASCLDLLSFRIKILSGGK